MGRKHIYELESFIRFFVLQNILGIPSDTLIINILNLFNELRIFAALIKSLTLPSFLDSEPIITAILPTCSEI